MQEQCRKMKGTSSTQHVHMSVCLSLTLLGWMTKPMRVSRTCFSKLLNPREDTIRSSRGTQEPALLVSWGGREMDSSHIIAAAPTHCAVWQMSACVYI